MSLFTLSDVTKSYQRDGLEPLKVLKGINLTVESGEFLTIVGKSGSGKSTLLQIMAAFDKPDGGSVLFSQVNIGSFNDRELSKYRNESVGFIFQFHHLLPEFSAEENVLMPALIGRQNGKRKRAADLLHLVGLSDRAGHKPGQLSGGEQQRVAIARALMNNPVVLFADEPTGNLDTANSESVFRILESVHKELSMTLIVVTHNPELAMRGTRKLELTDGQFTGLESYATS